MMKKNFGAVISFLTIFVIGFLIFKPALATDASLLPPAVQQFFDNAGNPLASGKVYFYEVGTSTFKNTYTSSAATTPYTNPITLNAGGKPPGSSGIYGIGLYRQLVKDRNGNTIWDAVTSPSGSGGGTPTAVGDGNLVGTTLPWSGLVAPNQYVFAYGQEISRTTYPEYFTAATQQANVICTASSNVFTGIADTTQINIGSPVELSLCVSAGTTVVSKTASTVTLSNPASVSINAVAVFFPYGNGDGNTTFNVPDLRGRTVAGRDNMGGSASNRLTSTFFNTTGIGAAFGFQSSTLTQANLPVNLGTATSVVTDPGHHHTVPTATGVTATYPIKNNGNLDASLNNTGDAVTGITVATTITNPLGGRAHSILQPTITLNYVVKVTPDTSTSIATGVYSIGGMTGVISCGNGLLCTGNIISSTSGLTTLPLHSVALGTGVPDLASSNVGTTNQIFAGRTGLAPNFQSISSLIPSTYNWPTNYITNGDFSTWTLCPILNCSVTIVNSTFSTSTGFPITPTANINLYPDSWFLGSGYGGTVVTSVRNYPDNQTVVPGYPQQYLTGNWTVAPTSASTTENPGSCFGPNITFGSILGCRSTYLESLIKRETADFGLGNTYTMTVWGRAGHVINSVANNGSGLCRFNIDDTSMLTTGQTANVAGVTGSTCNGIGAITVISGTAIDFAANYSAPTAVIDARINVQPVYISPILFASLGYQPWLLGQTPNNAGGYMTNTGSDGNFYVYQATTNAGSTTGLAVSSIADNGAGLCRLTVSSTANFTTGQTATTAGVSIPAGCVGSFVLTVISGTTLDLAASTYSSGYTTGMYVGVAPIQTTIGATQSDGNVTWTLSGFAKGRTYDLYEGQYTIGATTSTGYGQGDAIASDGATINPIGNACSVNATWTRCSVTIVMPAPEYNNTGDYAWSVADPVRRLLPIVPNNLNFGFPNQTGFQAGVDTIGPLGRQRIDYSQIKTEQGTIVNPYQREPHLLQKITSLPFEDVIGYMPYPNGNLTGFWVQTRYNDVGNTALFQRRGFASTVGGLSFTNPYGIAGDPTLTGTISASSGGTGFTSFAIGDLLQANTTTTLSKLPAVATGNALISGGISTVSSWGKIGLTTHVSGILPPANGGTGIANNSASTLTISGSFPTTLTISGSTSLTLPTTGTVATLSNNLGQFAATTSAQLASVISDETGTGVLVFGTAPTFTTSITDPLVIGGTGAASTLTLQSTSGAGTTDQILFKAGNNGANLAGLVSTAGHWTMGHTALTPDVQLMITENTALTVAPAAGTSLHIVGADGATTRLLLDTFGSVNVINARAASGTLAAKTALASGSVPFAFGIAGWDGSAYVDSASLLFVATETFSGTAAGTEIEFFTTPNTTHAVVQAATIQNSGCLSVGSTTACAVGQIQTNSAAFLIRTRTAYTNGAGALAGTLTNSPVTGNPTKWIPVDDNGTTRYIPAW